jgi:hypothetical protein
MNRRNFLSLFSAGVAGIALEQAIPLGRVWSFPKEIVIAQPLSVWKTDLAPWNMFAVRMPIQYDAYSYAAIRANGWKFPVSPIIAYCGRPPG